MKFIIIGSGSSGNSTLVSSNNTNILIDFGLSKKRVNEVLAMQNLNIDNIDAFFITHEHSDHISQANKIIKKELLYAPLTSLKKLEINDYESSHVIKNKEAVIIKDLIITPIELSHDSDEIFGYIIDDKQEKLALITDTGILPEKYFSLLKNLDYYIFESNYDENMLITSSRPPYLIKRILSDHGHLSNTDSGYYLSQIIGSNTKEVILAHISQDCNKPEIALNTVKEVIQRVNGIIPSNINFRVASRSEITIGKI